MKQLGIAEVREHLSILIDEINQSGDSLIVTRYGHPAAVIRPVLSGRLPKSRYPLRGTPIVVSDDFDKPAPELFIEASG
jgi:antitoxin (DNA-binding transcriptional repressor) of toxin-antitoxin stability system